MEQWIADIFASDERISMIRHYHEGFVPHAYKWPCPRAATEYHRDGRVTKHGYDAKRSHGRGPTWVAFSKHGGRLASE